MVNRSHRALCALCLAFAVTASPPVKLIIDTDIGGGGCKDVDDVAAVCLANALVDNGEAELLAVVHDTSPVQCVGAISVINHWYGRDDVPIGAYKGDDLAPAQPKAYVEDLVAHWPSPIKNSSQVPHGVDVYRRVLAAQPDRSVTISSIGLLTNLRALLESGADAHSPLGGPALVARKVRALFVMGGKYPTSQGTGFAECNVAGGVGADHKTGSAASSYVAAHWPAASQLVWSGFEVGAQVRSGGRLTACAPAANPCRQAFVDNQGAGKDRLSWDPLTTLIAVRGAAAGSCAACADCDGVNAIDAATGQNAWVAGPAANQSYVLLKDAQAAGDAIDNLLCQAPKNQRH
eukprot:g2065.t1